MFFEIGVGLLLATLVGIATNSELSWSLLLNRQWMKQAYGGLSRSMIVELTVMAAGIISAAVWHGC